MIIPCTFQGLKIAQTRKDYLLYMINTIQMREIICRAFRESNDSCCLFL